MSSPTLMAVHQGTSGPFVDWLKKLGLQEFLDSYSFEQLVEWGWLVPSHRVYFPSEFFHGWVDYPYYSDMRRPEFEAYSLAWDYVWQIDDENEESWFLDPAFRPEEKIGELLGASSFQKDYQKPDPIQHAAGYSITPMMDYYHRWQGLALVDLIRFADSITPAYQTPDLIDRAKSIVRTAESINSIHPTWPRDILDEPNRWGGLAEPMVWLGLVRSFRDAVFAPGDEDTPILRDRFKRGARQLATHLHITDVILEDAIRGKLLVLANQWLTKNGKIDSRAVWTQRALPFLQEEIQLAVIWLLILNDRPFSYYVDEWQKPFMGNVGWATLDEILPYAFLKHQKTMFDFVPIYLKLFNTLPNNPWEIQQASVITLCRNLQASNPPFCGFMSAFYELHEHITHWPSAEKGIDFRSLRPLDHFTMLAIHAEGCLRRKLDTLGILATLPSGEQALSKYIPLLSEARGVPPAVLVAFQVHKGLADLRKSRENPIGRIEAVTTDLPIHEHQLLQAFLCCLLARNYFAHHDFLDNELLHTSRAQFLLKGIVLTVLILA